MKNVKILSLLLFIFLSSCSEVTDQTNSPINDSKNCTVPLSLVASNNLNEIKKDLYGKTLKYLSTEDELTSKEYELFFFKVFKQYGHNIVPYFRQLKASDILNKETLNADPISCKRISNLRILSAVRSSLGFFQNNQTCSNTQACDSAQYADLVASFGRLDFNSDCLIGMDDQLSAFGNQLETESFEKLIPEKDCYWLLNVYLTILRFPEIRKHNFVRMKIEEELFRKIKLTKSS